MFNKRTLNHLELLQILSKKLKKQKIFYSVLGGFAVDGQLGKLTRDHKDLDIAIFEEDKPRLIKLFQKEFPDYKIHKNFSHKISFSKLGMLVDFLLLKNKKSKVKLEFSLDKNIPLQEESVFKKDGVIGGFRFNTIERHFLVFLLKRFYSHKGNKKTAEDLEKLKEVEKNLII